MSLIGVQDKFYERAKGLGTVVLHPSAGTPSGISKWARLFVSSYSPTSRVVTVNEFAWESTKQPLKQSGT